MLQTPYAPFFAASREWTHHLFTYTYFAVFEEIGERTLKSQVHNELYLPKQTRSVVPLDFSAIERFYYDSRYSEMLQALGLNADGTPQHLVDHRSGQVLPWKPDKAEMVSAASVSCNSFRPATRED